GQADLGVVAVVHDGFGVLGLGRFGAVDFEPDFQARVFGSFAAGDEGSADLLEGFLRVGAFGHAVGADFDAVATDVFCEVDELLAGFDVLLDDGGVGGLEFAGGAAAPAGDAGVLEAFADFGALVFGER